MWLGVLGTVYVRQDGAIVPVRAAKHRVLLAALLVHANRVVSFDQLAEILWDGAPAAGARTTVRNYVLRLRRVLGPEIAVRIVTRDPGYLIEIGDDELDLLRFAALYRDGAAAVRGAGWQRARDSLAEALGLWRGPALADVDSCLLHRDETPRLEHMRLQCLEWRIEADLNLGRHIELVPELQSLASQHPLHEHFHAQLMHALHRCGRQAEALAAYLQARQQLVEELGAEPGRALQEAHEQVLRGEPGTASADHPERATSPPGRRFVVPQQLPAVTGYFTGRVAELTALSELLELSDHNQAVVISAIGGTPGVGKTALALYWAHQVAGRFPDGQLYVNLRGFDASAAPVDPAEAVRGFLDALGVSAPAIPVGLDAQAALYRSRVCGRRLLIVVDNAKDEQQVRPLLPGSVGCLVVVTSRNRLTGLVAAEGAHPVSLDVLTAPEARELLIRRLGRERIDAEPDAAAELTRLCAGLPLALNLVAARAAADPHRRLAELATELASAKLDILNVGDAATSVRAVFSWSYRGLSGPAARAFRLLGLHPGPDVGLPAAASLLGETREQARAVLEELVRSHLLNRSPAGRFGLHDLLSAYAAEMAHQDTAKGERDAATRRLLDHYAHTASAAALLVNPSRDDIVIVPCQPAVTPERFDGPAGALGWLAAEYQVLLAAALLAESTGFDTHVWQIPLSLADFMRSRGHWGDWAAVQRRAMAAAKRLGDDAAQTRAQRSLGRALTRLGHFDDARTHLREALATYQRRGDSVWQARTHLDIANLSERQGRHSEGLKHACQALSLFQVAGELAGQASALNDIGWYHAHLGDYQQAIASGEEALRIQPQVAPGQSYNDAAAIWHTLGYARYHMGDSAAAVRCYQRALGLFRASGDRYEEAVTLTNLADAHAAGNLASARDAWMQALAILEDLGHPDADRLRVKLGTPAQARAAEPEGRTG